MEKWRVLLASIILQIILGGIYAWSVFSVLLAQQYGLKNALTGAIFGTVILTFTVAMVFAGRSIKTLGPRLVASIGAVLFMIGYVTAGFSNGNPWLLLLSIGLIHGAGIGFGYVAALNSSMQYFPTHKGLVSGLVVGGFGAGAIILSAFCQQILQHWDLNVLQLFQLLGFCGGAIALYSAWCLPGPQLGQKAKATQTALPLSVLSKEHVFRYCLLGLFVGTFAGLLTLGNLAAVLRERSLPLEYLSLAISIFSLGNISGRILWGWLSDILTARLALLYSLGTLAGSMLLLLIFSGPGVLAVVFFVGLCFGACFVVYAAIITKYYGLERFAQIYPYCFLGYGLAGITGPTLGGFLADLTHTYRVGLEISVLLLLSILCFIALTTKQSHFIQGGKHE